MTVAGNRFHCQGKSAHYRAGGSEPEEERARGCRLSLSSSAPFAIFPSPLAVIPSEARDLLSSALAYEGRFLASLGMTSEAVWPLGNLPPIDSGAAGMGK